MSTYKVELTLLADITVPENRADPDLPGLHWCVEVAIIGDLDVPSEALTGDRPIEIKIPDKDSVYQQMAQALGAAVNVTAGIERGTLDIEKMARLASEQGRSFTVRADFDEAQLARMAKLGLTPDHVLTPTV